MVSGEGFGQQLLFLTLGALVVVAASTVVVEETGVVAFVHS